jgi:hypothetical protein
MQAITNVHRMRRGSECCASVYCTAGSGRFLSRHGIPLELPLLNVSGEKIGVGWKIQIYVYTYPTMWAPKFKRCSLSCKTNT